MKKIISTLILTLLIIFPQTIFAGTNIDSYLNNKYVQEKSDSSEINNILQSSYSHARDNIYQYQSAYFNNNIKINDKNDITFGTPYKVYILTDLEKVKNNDKITNDLLNYYWEVTVYLNSNGEKAPISTIQFTKNDTDGWHLGTINGYLKPSYSDIVSNKSKLETFLQEQNITQLDNYTHFVMDNINFLYISENGNEYIIPLFDKEIGNMNAFKKNDYTTFKAYIGNVLKYSSNTTGGLSTKPVNINSSKNNYAKIAIISISIVIISATTLIILKKVKAKHA